MGRIADAFKRAEGRSGAPRDDQSSAPASLDFFARGQSPATDPWELGGERPSTGRAETAVQPGATSGVTELPEIVISSDEHPPAESPEMGRLVSAPQVPGFVKEQYRRLCARLHHLQLEHGIKVVMVTSALPHEGKTLTASNVALTLSESYGRQVALIDGDLRRPELHEFFGLNGAAPSSPFSGDGPVSLVQVRPTLALLAPRASVSDPLSALASLRMRGFFESARARFDWIVVDTPPAGLLPDASILSSMVDAVIVVARAGRTPYQAIEQACETVGRNRVIGVVLNCADRRAVASAAYNYRDEYYGR